MRTQFKTAELLGTVPDGATRAPYGLSMMQDAGRVFDPFPSAGRFPLRNVVVVVVPLPVRGFCLEPLTGDQGRERGGAPPGPSDC